jgi:3-isopropylmalate dehydratase small subunit
VTLPPDQLAELSSLIHSNSTQKYDLSLRENTLKTDHQTWTVFCDEAKRKALLSGAWDAISSLKENAALIKKTATELPYLKWLK